MIAKKASAHSFTGVHLLYLADIFMLTCALSFLRLAENLATEAGNSIEIMAGHVKGEICYFKHVNQNLVVWGVPFWQ